MPPVKGKPKNSIKDAMARERAEKPVVSIPVKRGVLVQFFRNQNLKPGQAIIYEGQEYKFVQRTFIGCNRHPTDMRVVFSNTERYFAVYWSRNSVDILPDMCDIECYRVSPQKGGMFYA